VPGDAAYDGRDVEPEPGAGVVCSNFAERGTRLSDREDVGDSRERVRHPLPRDQQAGEEDLREEERRPELNRLGTRWWRTRSGRGRGPCLVGRWRSQAERSATPGPAARTSRAQKATAPAIAPWSAATRGRRKTPQGAHSGSGVAFATGRTRRQRRCHGQRPFRPVRKPPVPAAHERDHCWDDQRPDDTGERGLDVDAARVA
jgi:hypothetical protein